LPPIATSALVEPTTLATARRNSGAVA
jgi:hypothetical protein